MALELPIIDDLTWDDLVTAGRRAIPAVSDGRWSHHGPLDAGMTVLELYAWLAEQQLYAYDRFTPAQRYALLRLAGVRPYPARPATTIMRVCADAEPVSIEAGTVVERPDARPPCRFTLDEAITAVPTTRVGLIVEGRDRGLDLSRGGRVRLTRSGTRASVDIVWWFAAPPTRPDGHPLALLWLLDPAGGVEADWVERDDDEPLPSPRPGPRLAIEWRYASRSGWRTLDDAALVDGTCGLRRSGVLRMSMPHDWAPIDDRAAGPWPYRLRMTVHTPHGVEPAIVRGLIPNVARARHRWTATHDARLPALPLPGVSLTLPLDGAPMLEHETRVTLNEHDGTHIWRPTDDLTLHDPTERVFAVDAPRGRLEFGDGRTGRQPVPRDPRRAVRVTYALGGGSTGTVGAGLTWLGHDRLDVRAVNVVPAVGGTDRETLDAAERRASARISRPERALTLTDIVHLARTTPGVAIARAHAVAGYHPRRAGVSGVPGVTTIFIVPAAHRREARPGDDEVWVPAPQPDAATLRAVAERLDGRRPIGVELFARPPCYRAVVLRCHTAGDTALRDEIERRLTSALRSFLDPLIGGEQGSGWPFGGRILPSALLTAARAAIGDLARVDDIELRLDDGPWNGCDAIELRTNELPWLSGLIVSHRSAVHHTEGLR